MDIKRYRLLEVVFEAFLRFVKLLERLFKEKSIQSQLSGRDVELEEIFVEMTDVVREIDQADLRLLCSF